jgi:hypothetical protein
MKSKLIKLMFALLLTVSGGISISILPIGKNAYAQEKLPENDKDGKKTEYNGLPACNCSAVPLNPDCTCVL